MPSVVCCHHNRLRLIMKWMRDSYLEVTFRHGRPLAAYLYLPRSSDQKSHQTKELAPGLLVDYTSDGEPIGVEITGPEQVSLAQLNKVLQSLGQPKLKRADLAPLRAA